MLAVSIHHRRLGHAVQVMHDILFHASMPFHSTPIQGSASTRIWVQGYLLLTFEFGMMGSCPVTAQFLEYRLHTMGI
jgi:hypothetical protein